MANWRERSEIKGDVVFFRYCAEGIEKGLDEVFVWDLDKTYLDTRIDSLSGILQAILERALAKRNVPGTDTLLRELSRHRYREVGRAVFPIYFITASPPQMEERISEKFTIDDIVPLGSFYKDNLRNLRPGRFARLTRQIGYKLQALMQLRSRLHPEVQMTCWGDDSESDAIIYNLFSDICARRITPGDLRFILDRLHVFPEQIEVIFDLQSRVPVHDPVERIYINLATDTDPEYYSKFGRRTLATWNTFQTAVDLFQNGRISAESVCRIALDIINKYGFTVEEISYSLDDLIRRRVLGARAFALLHPELDSRGILFAGYRPQTQPAQEKTVLRGVVHELEGETEPWVSPQIDYLHDFR
ncbi:MAG: hypothetical protein N2578_04780 [Bdellovibrionaceae bacterium]|nr:hypothetical protein [Pseudobdellovibrionaceae bacterium]